MDFSPERVDRIAAQTGYSRHTVIKILRTAGFTVIDPPRLPSAPRPRLPRGSVKAADVVDDYMLRKLSIRAISAKRGISYGQVHRMLTESPDVQLRERGRHHQ
jgi:Helix-turn-helix domain